MKEPLRTSNYRYLLVTFFITGVFKDVLNSYADGFFFLGTTTFIGAVILLVSNFITCKKKSENDAVDI